MSLIVKPSKIAGVGIFTTKAIRRGTPIKLFSKSEKIVLIKTKKPNFLIKRFCPFDNKKDGYWCPPDFSRMSIGWYINHSKTPNVNPKNWTATRHIKSGEEITANYSHL